MKMPTLILVVMQSDHAISDQDLSRQAGLSQQWRSPLQNRYVRMAWSHEVKGGERTPDSSEPSICSCATLSSACRTVGKNCLNHPAWIILSAIAWHSTSWTSVIMLTHRDDGCLKITNRADWCMSRQCEAEDAGRRWLNRHCQLVILKSGGKTCLILSASVT